MWRVQGNVLCGLNTKGKGQIIFFLVNASPKPLDVATSIFACAKVK